MGILYRDSLLTIGAIAFEAVVDFYGQLLDQAPQPLLPGVYAEFQAQNLRLGIFKPQKSHEAEFASATGSGLSLCLVVENVETAIAFLQSIGYPVPGTIAVASHGREIYIYDPAGNRIILYESN